MAWTSSPVPTSLQTAGSLTSALAALLPKCPLCLAGYAGALSSAAAGISQAALQVTRWCLLSLLVAAGGYCAWTAWRRRSLRALGSAAAAALALTAASLGSTTVLWLASALFLASTRLPGARQKITEVIDGELVFGLDEGSHCAIDTLSVEAPPRRSTPRNPLRSR